MENYRHYFGYYRIREPLFLALGNMWDLVTCVVAYTLLAIGSWFFSICPYCGHRLGIVLFVKRCPECGEELVYYY